MSISAIAPHVALPQAKAPTVAQPPPPPAPAPKAAASDGDGDSDKGGVDIKA